MTKAQKVHQILQRYQAAFYCPVPLDKDQKRLLPFAMDTAEQAGIDTLDSEALQTYITTQITENQAWAAFGGYGERRRMYERSPLFRQPDGTYRSIHLGIDIWMPPGTEIYSPWEAEVHSFSFRPALGDYGGVIILEHRIEGVDFYTLYGHLSKNSLASLRPYKGFKRSEAIGRLGDMSENGGWTPHLHLQIMVSLDGLEGDYPGVVAADQAEAYLQNCPNPLYLLNQNLA
ncbi:peptidoglycan DD-metalloendopeptidase family protein [Eisenibacter elegans]|uniref:peptidoglycan DD-metalloendopeptidase family protein n=1 Tax=Eisenibacter elegans TaxID=997 RepID=UPI0003FF9B2A|nr:peptidoglycan DD-metalloendopeptidase family protein [Eisenibacter elegans]